MTTETVDQEILESLRDDIGVIEHEDRFDTVSRPPSATALKLDDWSLRKGKEVLQASKPIKDAMSELEAWESDKDATSRRSAKKDRGLAVADFHAAAFEPAPEISETCKNERIHRYMKNLMGTKEFRNLHDETMLDEDASELAATHFATGYVKLYTQEETEAKERRDRGEGEDDSPEGEFKRDIAAIGAASGAISEATKSVGEWQAVKSSLGLGGGGAGDGGKMPKDVIAKAFKITQKSDRLKRICELAGKYRRLAQAQQRRKTDHGYDDMVGVELGGEIENMLPSELALLVDPDLELLALRKILDRSAMVRQYAGVENVGKGPIVIVVDESGSMDGHRIAAAKAIALALYWVAEHQNRYCCLVGFSGATQGNFLVIEPRKPKPLELLEWLEHFYSGGTDMDVPLEVLPNSWAKLDVPKGKTDIIAITDAACYVPDRIGERFREWKREVQARFTAIVLQADAGQLATVCDRTYRLDSLGIDEQAVLDVLSV